MGKHYLGDGVFAEFNSADLSVVLTTEDGIRTTNRIVLDPDVLDALGRYVQGEVYRRQAPTAGQALDARAHAGDGDGAAREAGVDEAERVAEIRNAVRAARLPADVAERMISEGVELDEARRMIVATLASKADPS